MARKLRRSGVPSGTIISFVMVAPVLNPISIAFGLSYIDLIILLYFRFGTFLVSSGIGLIWNYRLPRETNSHVVGRPYRGGGIATLQC